jgi:hypothetical protein
MLTLLSALTFGAETRKSGYLSSERLKYHGYLFVGDVLAKKAELRKVREYSNLIMFLSTYEKENPYLEITADSPDRAKEKLEFLRKEGERIAFLDSLGFEIIWPDPLSALIKACDVETYKKELRFIKKNLPEMALVDIIYPCDEPNLNDVSAETLEKSVDVFKAEFPEIKTMFCYAIVHPKFLTSKAPRNADILAIDPYMFTTHYENTAADFEAHYMESLACALDWINRQDKPFILVADAFASTPGAGKKMPEADPSLWYYMLALTQPDCIGLSWFYYGDPIEDGKHSGFQFDSASEALRKTHRQIGETILGEESRRGLESFDEQPAEDSAAE